MREARLRALSDAPEAFGSEDAETSERPVSEWVERAERGSEGGRQAMFVVDVDGVWQGMVLGHAPSGAQETCDLASMWVAPTLRGSGASRELVEAVLAWAAASGFARVALWVPEGNEAAERLYSSCGFECTGERGVFRPNRPLPIREMGRGVGA